MLRTLSNDSTRPQRLIISNGSPTASDSATADDEATTGVASNEISQRQLKEDQSEDRSEVKDQLEYPYEDQTAEKPESTSVEQLIVVKEQLTDEDSPKEQTVEKPGDQAKEDLIKLKEEKLDDQSADLAKEQSKEQLTAVEDQLREDQCIDQSKEQLEEAKELLTNAKDQLKEERLVDQSADQLQKPPKEHLIQVKREDQLEDQLAGVKDQLEESLKDQIEVKAEEQFEDPRKEKSVEKVVKVQIKEEFQTSTVDQSSTQLIESLKNQWDIEKAKQFVKQSGTQVIDQQKEQLIKQIPSEDLKKEEIVDQPVDQSNQPDNQSKQHLFVKTEDQLKQQPVVRIVPIQELEQSSDCSSGELNGPLQSPLVFEADSETEATVAPITTPSVTSTAPSAQFSPGLPSSSRADAQEQLRQKRAKRNALEMHFMPQLLSPRYLDSILEENSETTSTPGDLSRSGSATASNTATDQSKSRPAGPVKVNETFPRSHLDFSRRHKRREEPVALMLETKLIEQSDNLESCTRLQSTLSPQSEDAELVYLSSSSSSSVSDLMELELEEAAALAERTLIDLDTDASKLINRPDNELSSNTSMEPISSSNETETEGECEVETEVDTETEATTAAEQSSSRESTPVNAQSPLPEKATPTVTATATSTATPAATSPTHAVANEGEASKLANSSTATASLAATREAFVRNMDKVRELIEMTRREQSGSGNGNANGNDNGNGNENVNGNGSLPHISELQLSLNQVQAEQKDAWLGVPTQADPQLLVCLSPAQRALAQQQQLQPAADQLLDAHEKFVQRRGYHELSSEQVRAMDEAQLNAEQQQILKTAAKMRELRKTAATAAAAAAGACEER
ncbi:uncharacterized protein Dmoj_GI26737 [Drosophila mojavensis]|uniref:Uncharacterized protein n=1 Tax=Drosophila mojavensis TaxID=7230 RepID=A0A0Q9X883_DROMO|nr:uncharacterized protein Dmoj_GI26737 [Drosophila mojavensis]